MTSRWVCDASAVIALLLDDRPEGHWVADRFFGSVLAAPAVLPFEVANVARRQERRGVIHRDQAAQAHADLLSLKVELWPYAALADRCWELRANLSSYDACYVALAERLDVPLVTLDLRLANAPGIRCQVRTPPV